MEQTKEKPNESQLVGSRVALAPSIDMHVPLWACYRKPLNYTATSISGVSVLCCITGVVALDSKAEQLARGEGDLVHKGTAKPEQST